MRKGKEQASITGEYMTCCFCDKPKLKDGKPQSYNPRFEFMAGVKAFAELNSIFELKFSPREKRATGKLNAPCQHRDIQEVRMDWEMV